MMKGRIRLLLFGAFLLAFFLRVYLLGAQSLWNDEGTSIALAARSVQAIVSGAAQDIHPPLYYFLLHYWMPLAGQSEYAVRFLSVIAGVLTVALIARIAHFFFESRVADAAALFAAFSPFAVYYSQETRMYVWVAFWAALSVTAMLKMLEITDWRQGNANPNTQIRTFELQSPVTNSRTRRTRAWLLYIAATTAALYTHYFGATILIVGNLAFAIWLWLAARSGRPGIRHTVAFWMVVQVICVVSFLPWYLLTREQLATWPAISEPFDLPTLLWRVLNVFSVGTTLDATLSALAAITFIVLVVLAARLTRDPQTMWGVTLMVAWLLVPVLAMYAVSISRPAYNPKFLLLATPPFLILAARGLAAFRIQAIALGAMVLVLLSSALSLNNYYYDPRYARDDYRSILKFIDARDRAGDAILISAPGQIDVVRYYRRGDQQLFLLPRMRPPDASATRVDVDEMLAKTWRLFAVYYATEQSDPARIIETRLAEYAFKASDEWHGNVRLAIYGVAPNPRGREQSVAARFGNEIDLTHWRLDAHEARPGDVLTLTLKWVALTQPTARYKVFVQLLDSSQRVIAQRDGEPVADTRLTTTWRAEQVVDDNYGVFVEQAGEFTLQIGMYRADTGVRLQVYERDGKLVGDHLTLASVRVLP